MSVPNRVQHLIDYEIWAMHRVLAALRDSPAPKYKSTLLFAHILNVYALWYERIAGRPPSVDAWAEQSIDECEDVLKQLETTYRDFVSTLAPADLERRVAYRNPQGSSFENTVGDILMHLVIHSSYHRGQINGLIRGAGAEPAIIDYVAFTGDK